MIEYAVRFAFLAVVLFVIGVLAGSMARDTARPLPHEDRS